MLKLLRKKPAVSLPKFIIYKIVYVVIHFVIIIVSYLALIGLLLVEIGFCQIKRKYIKYNTMQSHVAPLLKPIVMNLEQLIFTWKERQLVLALLTSSFLNEIANLYQGFNPLAMFLKNSAY